MASQGAVQLAVRRDVTPPVADPITHWGFNHPSEENGLDSALKTARYISLVTFRKDGREVATPIWFADLGGKLYAYTDQVSGKVKRIRANGRVKVAPCGAAGGIRGAWTAGMGRVVTDSSLASRAMQALATKYGWQFRMIRFFARFSRRFAERAVLELSV